MKDEDYRVEMKGEGEELGIQGQNDLAAGVGQEDPEMQEPGNPEEQPTEEPDIEDMIEMWDEYPSMKVELTEQEKRDMADRMARGISRIQELQDEMKAMGSQLKATIAAEEAQVRKDATLMRQGYEIRNTKVKVLIDYRSGILIRTREDTGEVILSRPLTQEESQRKLNL